MLYPLTCHPLYVDCKRRQLTAMVYSFAHDRYIHAAEKLTECQDVQKMHFVIAHTMIKYDLANNPFVFICSTHICESAPLIKQRVKRRFNYRKFLVDAANAAVGSGARGTALKYLATAISLLQASPWDDKLEDVEYKDTLNLHIQAAQLYWHQGEDIQAQHTLNAIFSNVVSARDKTTSWVIQSRIFMRKGQTEAALGALKTSLAELGLGSEAKPSWASCDEEYHVLRARLQSIDHDFRRKQSLEQSDVDGPAGVVLVEAISAAFWTDKSIFYQMVLRAADLYTRDFRAVGHIGLGLAYFALVCSCYINDQCYPSHDLFRISD